MDQRLLFVATMLLILPSIAALDPWVKANLRPVCFGARDNQYGSFNVPYGGKIAAVKLVHLSGYVTCRHEDMIVYYSFWGCGNHTIPNDKVGVLITTSGNTIITPISPFLHSPGPWSVLPGYNSFSPEIILPRFAPYPVSSGQELRLWYYEDLAGYTEDDNGGWVCCNVYALYVE